MGDLEFKVTSGVGTITLNRPEKKNAFTLEMIDEWAGILTRARTDPAIRVMVVTGAGQAFCSGIDLGGMAAGTMSPLAQRRRLTDRIQRVALAAEDLDKPLIAAVNGVAVGAGLDMALMCDIRFAAASARMSEGYIRVGLVPGDGGCYFLPRLVGMGKALELLMSGDFVDAAEAHRIGLVNRVFDDESLIEETYAFAERLAALPPVSLGLIRRATYQSARSDLRTALDLVASHVAVVTSTRDTQEALNAFRDRRPADFSGD
jgi:enoyl-CoA hydratase/carnithine racemase